MEVENEVTQLEYVRHTSSSVKEMAVPLCNMRHNQFSDTMGEKALFKKGTEVLCGSKCKRKPVRSIHRQMKSSLRVGWEDILKSCKGT